MGRVLVSGGFDDLRAAQIRFLQEASRLGPVRVALWSDPAIERLTGAPPKFPEAERRYLLESIRFVESVFPQAPGGDPARPADGVLEGVRAWVMAEGEDDREMRAWAAARGIACEIVGAEAMAGFPYEEDLEGADPGRQRVIVTGCYDWFHSGHTRFFEEVSGLGDLYVVVGNDANVRFLKGDGHPMFDQAQRRYVVGANRHVRVALVSTGWGWLDAEPEIARVRPHVYAVNEDGDRPEKRAFCEANGIQYLVLERVPKEGLTRRQSTALRGF